MRICYVVVRILIIEDHPQMAAFLRQGLTESGFSVDLAANGEDGERMASSGDFSLIILDLMLPDVPGMLVCRNLRHRNVTTPVLILSALSSTGEKVSGLEAGADDYLIKPFEFEELTARVRALLRRGSASSAMTLTYSDVEMDLSQRVVDRDGQRIKLTVKEFALLEFFLRNPGVILTRSSISEKVWSMNFDPESNVIDVYVSMLRRKIEKGFKHPLIHTMIGRGYMLSQDTPNA
jgi:two-component system copper resistance phosphate regulon response regulator CusR